MKDVTTIGFDADDTLWHNEVHFRFTEQRFADLLSDYADNDHLLDRLLEAERRNVHHYGWGIKGFTLSMIETAIEVTEGRAPASVISDILASGRELLRHPVETFPGVAEALEQLKGDYRLVVITKGDLFDQERKLAASGIDHLFDAVEIVSDKKTDTYDRIFNHHGDGPARSVMIGNSLRSDILPALEAGAWAVYVPHELTFALEHAEEPVGHERFKRIEALPHIHAVLSGEH